MKELPWFRLYPEIIYDEKINVAANRTDSTYIEVLGLWVVLLALASKSPMRGSLYVSDKVPYEDRDIAAACGMVTKQVRDIIDAFIDLNMLDDNGGGALHVKNWDDRQYAKEEKSKESNALRQERYREKHSNALRNGYSNALHNVTSNVTNNDDVTLRSVSVSVNDSESFKELNAENSKKYFTSEDAERMYLKVTGFASVPSTVIQRLLAIQDMLNAYGYDDTFSRLTNAKDNWVSQKNKTNGATYKLTNPAWIDYAITGETLGAPPKLSAIDREKQELEELIKKGQK